MKTHFTKLRRLTLWSSTIAPFLQFAAFLCVAKGFFIWALIPLVLGLLLLSFPTELILPAQTPKSEWGYSFWIRLVGSWFFIYWILIQPGAMDLINHLMSTEALWDWRLILAVFIWCLNWSYSNYRKTNELTDHEILAIYDDSARERIRQQAKPE